MSPLGAFLLFVVASGCTCRPERPASDDSVVASPPSAPAEPNERRISISERLPGDPPLPGIAEPSEAAAARLREAVVAMGPDYEPRTGHRDGDAPRYTNRLILENSPYLLQHAHNPVSWFPWGPEAFERARAEGKPILLSVGYSTCHWCHVMERESFEDLEIATYLNEHFIAIKVDREERPDIDDVYMRAVQLMTGAGGWPMTVALTPDGEPFFGGTYFPARDGDRGAQRGFGSILRELVERYQQAPDVVAADARRLSQRIAESASIAPGTGVPGPETMVASAQQMARAFDATSGGFGRAPKFPEPSRLAFLMRYYRRTRDPGALLMVERTLDAMARGGIYDHVGGGFHRYATDSAWLVPHFEKMLYDNAQLASVYVEAWQLTGRREYRAVAEDILDYVVREMTSPSGAFYSATDADSESASGELEEGAFFVWTEDEIRMATTAERARVATALFAVTERGNFEGANVLHRPEPDEAVARALGIDQRTFAETARDAIVDLRRVRAMRPAPVRDDKILTAWNGLMISAFARAATAFGRDDYRATASRAADFVLRHLRDEEGRLLRSHVGGHARHNGYLDDYAFFTAALIDTFEATGEIRMLREALALSSQLDEHHLDPAGGWFATSDDHEELLVRDKPIRDGALPSGNAVAIENALRLSLLTGDRERRAVAERAFVAFSEPIRRRGSAMPRALCALDFATDVPLEIVIVHPAGSSGDRLRAVVGAAHLPNAVQIVVEDSAVLSMGELLPLVVDKAPLDGEATAFVCEEGRCQLPTNDPSVLRRQVRTARPLLAAGEPPRLVVRLP